MIIIKEDRMITETLEILSNKKLMKDIKRGKEDIRNKKYITFEEFKKKHKLY